MGVRDQLTLTGSVLRVGATVAAERARGRGPVTAPDAVPARVEDLTPEWLTAALCRDRPGARVVGVELGGGSEGTSSRRALTVSYNEAGTGLPTAVYTKSTPRFVSRVLVGVTGAAGAEALFYDRIRQHLDIGAPAGYAGAWDPRSCRSMVLAEDVSVTRGATFPDAAVHIDRRGAESMVREMARYHGALWEDPRLDREWTSLRDALTWQRKFNASTGMDAGAVFAFRFAREEIPDALHARRREVRPAFARSLEVNVRLPRTLLHQDVHPRNWFHLPDGALHLYDWQGIAKGNWALDVAYALSAALDVEDRRAWERDLIALYLDELAAAGGKSPSFEEGWLAYRQQMLHGLIFWTYTLLVGKVSELQPETYVRTLIRRTSQAVVDLETLNLLRT
ncbi:phosphotransferase family protein [Sporichthya polymorpha]|uniref:phosphotransferase family protein n=1 Tax=Sporichthya polymorpha TaxID=35751 RepID=UPI00037D1BF7|nr:phosphotransferase [Sporichthya polymorpha]